MASIAKRGKRWRARYRDGDGREHAKTFDRKVDAEAFLVQVQHSVLSGTYIRPEKQRTTVADYYVTWKVRQSWRPSSRASVESMFDQHVIPRFGSRSLGSIRSGDIEHWAAGLDLAPRTAGLALRYFGRMLDGAVRDGHIASNPAHGAARPKVERTPVKPFTLAELNKLRDAAPDWFRVSMTLGAICGLRLGEATGLTLDRLNMLGRTLTVDRQMVTPARGTPTFGPPKTDRSFRTVPLADVAIDDLAAHLAAHGTGVDGLVLHENGGAISRQRFGKIWRQVRNDAGLPGAVFHNCRHTYASTLLSGGVSVAAAAAFLGHSPAVLLGTYAHLMPEDDDRARNVVQTAFARADADSLRTDEESVGGSESLTSGDATQPALLVSTG